MGNHPKYRSPSLNFMGKAQNLPKMLLCIRISREKHLPLNRSTPQHLPPGSYQDKRKKLKRNFESIPFVLFLNRRGLLVHNQDLHRPFPALYVDFQGFERLIVVARSQTAIYFLRNDQL